MITCLQKTLLLYAPLLLLSICSAAWSRDASPVALSPSHHAGADIDDSGGGGFSDSGADTISQEYADAGETASLHGGDNEDIALHQAHHKTRRNHKMMNGNGRHGHRNHHGGGNGGGNSGGGGGNSDPEKDLALWIHEDQVALLSGISMRLYAIYNGRVNYYVKDPRINQNLPTIPSEVHSVNFTWGAGGVRKYRYQFDRLQSLDETILKAPTISIKLEGMVPQLSREFSVALPCATNASGTAIFSVGLLITRRGKPVPGTPIRLSLKKECAPRGVYDTTSLTPLQEAPDPECDKTCANLGRCNKDKICQCPQGFMGPTCQTGLCFPQCMNGGNCTAPGKCSCPPGFHGKHCEGGICVPGCLNGGKCIQKDQCHCSKGYYGTRCESSKCPIRCLNGGKCIGNNKCRCPAGLSGDHCQVGSPKRSPCRKACGHGSCGAAGTCQCHAGWFGKFCNQAREKIEKNTLL